MKMDAEPILKSIPLSNNYTYLQRRIDEISEDTKNP